MISKKLVSALSCTVVLATAAVADNHKMSEEELIKLGKETYMNKSKGNCLACHALTGAGIDQEGNMGPNLANFASLPDEYFYNKIWDPNKNNPNSMMPPLGRNHRVTDQEIKAIIAFVKHVAK